MLVEILQLVHEISSFPEKFFKKGVPKTFQNLHVNTRSSHLELFCQKGVLSKNLAKFLIKRLCLCLFLNIVGSWKPEALSKNRLPCNCFPVNLVNILRTLFLENICERLQTWKIVLRKILLPSPSMLRKLQKWALTCLFQHCVRGREHF